MSQIDELWGRFSSWHPDILTGPLDIYSTGIWLESINMQRADSLFRRNFQFQLQVDQFGRKGLADIKNIMHQTALLQQAGLSQLDALKTITSVPAKILDIEERVGSIEVGKDADLNIFSEPPLEVLSLPDIVMVNGQIVNESRR
ncbi:MAG: Adenine deaminase [Candidatus Marinimicrobia bacterium]|nr:Adenine deaminase [Candidatus Neomarinimicrobiota bacterium]